MDSALKWPGGKHYLASKIISLMPPHTHYVELYAGAMSVLFSKNPEGVSEVANDLNRELTDFWRVMQDKILFQDFMRLATATPFSKIEFDTAVRDLKSDHQFPPSHRAWKFFIHCRQSLAGRMDSFAGITKSRTRRAMNEQVSAWTNAIEGLPDVHDRLMRVLVLCEPALSVIDKHDTEKTLFYADPPYMHETRNSTGEYGQLEMTPLDHADLLVTLGGVFVANKILHLFTEKELSTRRWWYDCPRIRGRFLLSGYRSELYDLAAEGAGWQRFEFTLPNNAASGTDKRRMVECVWRN